ncbi:MAG TPA: Cache 3/Cache 2 fusion domain-containing protein [Capsulimonadaceae bacterium]
MKIRAKLLLMNLGGIFTAVVLLLLIGQWQSNSFSQKSGIEAAKLADSDLNHTVLGAYNMIKAQGESVTLQVEHNMKVTHQLFQDKGQPSLGSTAVSWNATNQFTKEATAVQLPQFQLGGKWLGQNSDIATPTLVVDKAAELTGCRATIFQRMNARGDMLRVATNVVTKANKRAIGTYIPAVLPTGKPSPIISAILAGKPFVGPAFIVNAWYISNYEPIRDSSGKVIGMLFSAVPQNGISSLNSAVSSTKIGKTGSLSIIGGPKNDAGKFVISKDHGGEDGLQLKDEAGKGYVQDIIDTAVGLGDGQIASKRYLTREPGESTATWKTVRVAYYAPWSWVVVASAPESDFAEFGSVLDKGRRDMMLGLLVGGIAVMAFCAVLGVVSAARATKPLTDVANALHLLDTHDFASLATAVHAMESGDLTVDAKMNAENVAVTSQDEIGQMATAFNSMLATMRGTMDAFSKARGSLSGIIGRTRGSANDIERMAEELTEAHGDLSTRTSTQASNLEETAASMEEMTVTIKQNADRCQSAAVYAEKARSVAASGGSIVSNASDAMKEINGASHRIADIVSVIDEIAFQTNLLALNAAVEAARVGEQGRGFAVVAQEVRSLATRSSVAAKDIKALVNDTVQKVEQGSEHVLRTGQQLTEIVASVNMVADMISEISNSSREQAEGIEQVNKAVMDMERITQQNAALVEQATAATHSMSDQATELNHLVSTFKTSADESVESLSRDADEPLNKAA